MVTATIDDVDVDVDLAEIIDAMERDELTVLAMYIAAALNETPEPVAIAWPEGNLVIDPAQGEPERPNTVSVETDVDIDLDDVLPQLERYELEELLDDVAEMLDKAKPVSMEALYYAVRDGDREKVFEMAREMACDATGRVC